MRLYSTSVSKGRRVEAPPADDLRPQSAARGGLVIGVEARDGCRNMRGVE